MKTVPSKLHRIDLFLPLFSQSKERKSFPEPNPSTQTLPSNSLEGSWYWKRYLFEKEGNGVIRKGRGATKQHHAWLLRTLARGHSAILHTSLFRDCVVGTLSVGTLTEARIIDCEYVTLPQGRGMGEWADIDNCWWDMPSHSLPHHPTIKPLISSSLFQPSLNTPWLVVIAR